MFLIASVLVAPVARPDAADLPGWLVAVFATATIGVVSFIAFTLLSLFARQRQTAQNRVESLPLNILPTEVAHRLQEDQRAIADHFDEATVLFADVVDFTPLSSRYEPRELVAILDRLFSSFYDLWGDAVNMASRMESHGLPGQIQITRSTWELLRDDFVCEPRGLVDVKGKGPVQTWTLIGPREQA